MADIGRAVGALGAVVMSPAEFLSRIEGGRVGGGDATGDGEKPAAGGDVEYWLRQFGKTGDGDD
jgi:hypothetical protein